MDNSDTDRINQKYSVISIFLSVLVISNVILFKKHFITTKVENKFTENNYKIDNSKNLITRSLQEANYFYNFPIFDINGFIFTEDPNLEYKKNVTNFFKNVSSTIYEGTWSSQDKIVEFEKRNGNVRLHLNAGLNFYANESQIVSGIKFFEEEYSDNWYFIRMVKGFPTIFDEKIGLFDFTKNSLSWDNFDAYIIQGHLFDKTSETFECKANLRINWDYKYIYSIPVINRIRGNLFTKENCEIPLNINFATLIEDSNKENLAHVFYSMMVTALCLSQIISTVWLNQKIVDSFSNSNSISLFTVGQNIIWNAYGCLCHFFLAVNNEQYVTHFGIPSFLYFFNFSIFELRLLYNLWKNQNVEELNDINVVRKKLIKFYITFYIFLFLSLFFVTKFYFEPAYIIAAFLVTWIPQIIHNVIYKNQSSMPLINIILNTINKALIPIYFRGCPKNIFQIKTDTQTIYILVVILIVEVVFLYLQTLCGPRFFIPCKISTQSHKFYRNKEEILNVKKDFEFAECSICLFPLFSSEPIRKVEEELRNDFFEEPNQPKRCNNFLQKIYNVFFDFHEYHFFNKKSFMITPCNHVFHTECLENWLKLKRECPTDRTIIPPIEQ